MENIALIAAAVAAFVLALVGIKAYLVLGRFNRLADRFDALLDSEVRPAVRALADAARGTRTTLGKLDEGLDSLASTLARLERLTANLEPDSVSRTLVQPLLAKLLAWVAGVRKGIRNARRRGPAPSPREGGEGAEAESG